ncbi:hypothetical protein M422DRAFT_239455 [Sphaerobolus stellatus SS14]|nr:hypothetical protein M422DRAFT_239455 [Sphaerobolus stellatus SS14]
MTVCSGCGEDFPYIGAVDQCSCCVKLSKPQSDAEKWTIMEMPQCEGCGSTYLYLTPPYCRACKKLATAATAISAGSPGNVGPTTASASAAPAVSTTSSMTPTIPSNSLTMSNVLHRTHELKNAAWVLLSSVQN